MIDKKLRIFTATILFLLEQIDAIPEKEINDSSPAEHFFNVVVKRKNGKRFGVVYVEVENVGKRNLEIEITPQMPHEKLCKLLFFGICDAISEIFVGKSQNSLPTLANPRLVYSRYNEEVEELRVKIREKERELKKAQKKFHNAETRYQKVLETGRNEPAEKKNSRFFEQKLAQLDAKTQQYNIEFCRIFEENLKLCGMLELLIHKIEKANDLLAKTDSSIPH